MEEIPFDSKRRLCPDGACVGVIGADGRCSVCRRPAGAAAAWVPEADPEGGDAGGDARGDDSASTSASAFPAPVSSPSSDTSSGFDAKRRLCDDGSCVGIVGADGICGSCGRRAE